MHPLLTLFAALLLFSAPALAQTEAPPAAAAAPATPPAAAPAPGPADPAAPVTTWRVDKEQSSIGFSGKQMGAPFMGGFAVYDIDIAFDPARLDLSKVKVSFNTASAHTGEPERDGILRGEHWFDASRFPVASYESAAFRQTGGNSYIAEGTLTIRDVTRPVSFPFTLDIQTDADSGKKTARMEARFTLDRSDFNLGRGEWQDTGVVANNVDIAIVVVAEPGVPADTPGTSYDIRIGYPSGNTETILTPDLPGAPDADIEER